MPPLVMFQRPKSGEKDTQLFLYTTHKWVFYDFSLSQIIIAINTKMSSFTSKEKNYWSVFLWLLIEDLIENVTGSSSTHN